MICLFGALSSEVGASQISIIIVIDHEPAYTPPPPPPHGGFYHTVISGYLDHQSTQFRLSASELLLFVSVVLVLINALYGIPDCDDLVS